MGRAKGSKNGERITLPPVTCQGCGKSYVPERSTFGKFCSQVCMQNRVTKQCPQCQKIFAVKASKAHKYTFCSIQCRKASSPRPIVQCEQCGKPFEVNQARGDIARYCSYNCHHAAHHVLIQCAYCGKERTLKKYRFAEGANCCTNRCATLLRMRDGFEPGSFGVKRRTGYHTDIETLTEQVLIALKISFLFEYKVGRYSVDFALPTMGITLECDGWQHLTEKGKQRDKVRDEALTNEGWKVIHIPDKAIRTDAYSAVTAALKDHL